MKLRSRPLALVPSLKLSTHSVQPVLSASRTNSKYGGAGHGTSFAASASERGVLVIAVRSRMGAGGKHSGSFEFAAHCRFSVGFRFGQRHFRVLPVDFGA